ncbi:hypothetical protein [Kribbella speibonae]|uniref:Phage tail tape measure protein n=1 Tax=Kribbella speibonae TaxID=1572660 RepID=A0ABY2AAJ0_9ACTN|nr:hypothetical protein [Kribbella speibonae]TCC26722.1 hypothetical protein E0H58_01450 [Kribbella speibonae]
MAGKNQVTLTFAGDADKLSKTFSEVDQKSQALDSSVRKSSKSIAQSKDAFDKAADGADNTYDKFDSLESLGRGTTDTMSGLGAIMAGDVLGGSTDLAGGVAALADGFKGALLPALKNAIGGLKAAGGAVKAFTASLLTNPIFLVVTALTLLGVGLATAYKHSESFRNGVNAVWNGIKAVIVPVLETIWNAVKTTFEGFITVVTKLIKFLPGGNKLLQALGTLTEDAGDAMKDTGPAAETWEEAQKRLNEQVDIANQTIQTQLDLLDKWYGEVKSQEEATIGFAQSVDDAAESIKENGKTTDIHTEKGRNNRSSLLDLADANKDLVDAMRNNGAASDTLVAQNERGRKKFLEVAGAMGLPKSEAKALADQLFRIPEATNTKVNVNNKDANSKIATTTQLLKKVPTYKEIEIHWTQSGVPLNTIGSAGRRAAGGPVQAGKPYMVGENGPEMWVPNANGSIVPTHKMGGGGDTTVYVTIDGEQLQGRIDKTIRGNNRQLKREVSAA